MLCLATIGLSVFGFAGIAEAKSNTVILAGSDWLNGSGVSVYSNDGSYESNEGDFNYVDGVKSGYKWQCVELVNRLYLARGWTSSTWSGNAVNMFNTAPGILSKESNGSITSVRPGDVVVFGGGWGGYGHVMIVDSVSGSTVSIVSQNMANARGTLTWNRASKTIAPWTGYSTVGVVHAPAGGSAPPPDPYFHGIPPDGAVIENHDGDAPHKYVAIGGSLVWIPPETIWGYVDQMHAKFPAGHAFHEIVWMHNDDIHAIEYGFGGNRSHVPVEGSFFYENGSSQQYMVRFSYALPVAGLDELNYLGGVNRAIMVPAGTYARLRGTPDIPNDVLFRSLGPALYHEVNGIGLWVPNTPTADCIRVGKHGEFRPVPESLITTLRTAGRLSNEPTNCEFPHGQVLYGQGSGRQVIVLYEGAFAISSSEEVATIGAVNLAQPVADVTIDAVLGETPRVPQGHVFRAGSDAVTYQYIDGILHPIGTPLLRDCLLASGGLGLNEEVVPRSFIKAFSQGSAASCHLDDRQLLAPGGVMAGHVKDGVRHWIPNPAIRDCLAVRSSTGQPTQATGLLWDSYSAGAYAYCPYEHEPGLNFVQEEGSSIVWLVGPAAGGPGVKRHAGTLCVSDPYSTPIKAAHVFVVPAGETAGHAQGPDWWPTGADCQALPQG